MNSEGLHLVLSKVKQGLLECYQDLLESVILYGSQARGDATEDSDIDVLVVLKSMLHPCDEMDKTLDLMSQICLDYDVVISWQFISVTEFYDRDSPFILNVKREGILL
jgi:predicted nucleotidyltransferase